MSSTASNLPSVAQAQPPSTQAPPAAAVGKKTYGQILKSSAMIGGASVINIAVGIVRTKVMAFCLGTAGYGTFSLFTSVLELTQSIAGMGINSSGVRQIAESAGTGDTERIARTATVLRRVSIILGIIGGLLLVAFCRPISMKFFGTTDFALPVALLSFAVFFKSVSAGQEALIQGMRRIADLAKIAVVGSVLGTTASLTIIYFFRQRGIVPALIAVAGAGLLTAWWYRRKIQIRTPRVTVAHVRTEATALLKLGFAFMASGILTMGAAAAIKIIVRDNEGIAAAGLYQSAWALGGLYVGIILQAMGSDFYPRLTGVAQNHPECNRLVNEQAEVSLLLAGPGVIATLTFAPVVIWLFYTREFMGAVNLLRWICLGMALRVIAWPMGFIILAKGVQSIFFWTEVIATVVHVGLALLAIPRFGVTGAGIAFFGLYAFHSTLVYFIVRRLTGFRWFPATRRIGLPMLSMIAVVFCGFLWLPAPAATAIGAVAAAGSSIFSIRMLIRLVSLDAVPASLRRLLARFGFTETDSSLANPGK